jgi:hypothetical protein
MKSLIGERRINKNPGVGSPENFNKTKSSYGSWNNIVQKKLEPGMDLGIR